MFQGQYLDTETELVYNYKRYYSQETGAYISQDPIGLAGKNPTIYGYVFDSNIEIDPLGLNVGDPYGAKLTEHLRQASKYGQGGIKELENGRIRYYDNIKIADKYGEMKGMRPVREWDPATGKTRTWMETIDHKGKVRQVRPQENITNGQKIHYRFDENGNYIGTKEGITRNKMSNNKCIK
ncbi:RHS repeat-associated core domain-containing protein [Treponema pedis]|uniref:RHS repeat-associated core domain-containing protein n=1 Tax=Treponema pedis TaxID=409322 RepID=UPI000402F9FA|nr:RHS repeat-associated core domain-containing protein [Treponema pedis]